MADATHERMIALEGVEPRAYANLGRRLAAFLLDLPIVWLSILIPVMVAMRGLKVTGVWVPADMDVRTTWSQVGVGGKLSVYLGFLLVAFGPLYFILLHASPWQATLGKRLMNIYVTDSGGQRIGIGRSLGRLVAWCFLAPFGLNLVSGVMVAVTQNRKGLHDLIAGTQVLEGRTEGVVEPWRILVAVGVPVAWLVCAFLATM